MSAFLTKPLFNRVELYGVVIWVAGTHDLTIWDKVAWFGTYVLACLVAAAYADHPRP